MSCYSYFILQKQQNDGSWVTVLDDCLSLMTSAARDFCDWCDTNMNRGVPADIIHRFDDKTGTYHENGVDYNLGEWGFTHFTFKELQQIAAALHKDPTDNYQVFKDDYEITISFEEPEYNAERVVQDLIAAMNLMFSGAWNDEYRFIGGFG